MIAGWIDFLPNELIVAILAAMPVIEMRASIPVGIAVYHLTPLQAYTWSLIGNLIPVFLLFLFLPKTITFLSDRSPKMKRFFERYFFRFSEKYAKTFDRYGALFLFFVVAIPDPGSGAWTGCLLAVLFRVHTRYALPAIIAGAVVAGLIILSLTQATTSFF